MKSSTANKGASNASRTKRGAKDREKRKSQGNVIEVNNHTSPEKGSPIKESNRLYAGVDAEIIQNYADQTVFDHLSEEVTEILTEDINYRLRYLINDSILKARLSGRNAITCGDLESTFENLKVGKVYGAPRTPNWIGFGEQGLYCLEDDVVNLMKIADEEQDFYQHSDAKITTKWVSEPKEISKTLRKYFSIMCEMLISEDTSIRRRALININENSRIGPLTEWFYNFGYILLSKDITYDCLTLRALDLITVLENNPICTLSVSERLLKLLVRLILQRILKSGVELLKPLCSTLTLLCSREPLKQFVLMKLLQKMEEIFPSCALPIITIANAIGLEAVLSLILPNVCLFLHKSQKLQLTSSILESYYILSKAGLVNPSLYELFSETLGDAMVIFNEPVIPLIKPTRKTRIKNQLFRIENHCEVQISGKKLRVEKQGLINGKVSFRLKKNLF